MPAQRFEDLIAWQKARELTKLIYQSTRKTTFGNDYGLARQIQRAAVSVMSNIAEGFERGNEGDFHRFLSIAKASCGEVRSQLYVAVDVGYLSQTDFDSLMQRTYELSRVIGGLHNSVVAKYRRSKR
jgi:four helix bundle protein